MEINGIKERISKETGISIELLNGESVEDVFIKAKALIAFCEEKDAKTTREQFANYADAVFFGLSCRDRALQKLEKIEGDYEDYKNEQIFNEMMGKRRGF